MGLQRRRGVSWLNDKESPDVNASMLNHPGNRFRRERSAATERLTRAFVGKYPVGLMGYLDTWNPAVCCSETSKRSARNR
jgi:hypothetical protein